MTKMSAQHQPTPLPPDAINFTVEAMAAQEAQKVQEAEKKTQANEQKKRTQKAVEQMLKPPPASVINAQIKHEEKVRHEMEEIERRKVMKIIIQYFERFPGLAKELPKPTARMSLAEAQELLEQIREAMNTRGSLQSIAGYFDYGFMGLEKLMENPAYKKVVDHSFHLNLTGLSAAHRKGEFMQELGPIIAEIDIEYPGLGRRPLIIRAIQAIGEAALKVHYLNTDPNARKILEHGNKKPVHLGEDPDV